MATWELFRDGTKEQDLINVQYIDSANPFGDYIIAQVEDNLGQKFDKFEYATEIEVTVTPEGGTQISKFVGFVVERRENDQQGQDVLEVEAYSFDQFLRQSDVSNDQSGKLISDAIEDIIKEDTPISFNASKVSVSDETELTQSLQDERVETALQILSFKSANEGFGVDDSLEFFFRPREQTTISRGIDNTQWFNYDIPERGKEAVNEVEVRFDDGDRSVIVDDGGQKLQLQNSLNLPEPASQKARISRPSITDRDSAADEAKRFLKFKNVTLTGTITTFGLFNAEPFDVIDVEIIPRGIESQFIITQIEYNWGRDETTLTIVENRGFDQDLFIRLAEKTERVDLQGTISNVEDKVVSTNIKSDVTAEITVQGNGIKSTTTNDCVDKIVSGWTGDSVSGVGDIVVGDTANGLSRADGDLENQTNAASATQSTPQSNQVVYDATITQNNIKEVGLKDTTGTLLCRGVLDTAVNISGNIAISITVTDTTRNNGVLTDHGQSVTRDIITGDGSEVSPLLVQFGDSNIQPQESNLTLNNTTEQQRTDETQLQYGNTRSNFRSILSDIPDTSPVKIEDVTSSSARVTSKPVAFTSEAENLPNSNFSGQVINQSSVNGDLSGGQGVQLSSLGDFVEFEFTPEYDVPINDIRAGAYVTAVIDGYVEYKLNDRVIFQHFVDFSGTIGTQNTRIGHTVKRTNEDKISAGETQTLRIEVAEYNSGTYTVDAVFGFDSRPKFNINTSSGLNASGTFDSPEPFPDSINLPLQLVPTQRELSQIDLTQTWIEGTANNAAVTLSIGNTSTTINNPNIVSGTNRIEESLSVSASNAATSAQIIVDLSRFTDSGTDYPAVGDGIQSFSNHVLTGNPKTVFRDGIGQVETSVRLPANDTVTQTLRESGQFSKQSVDALTHSVFGDVSTQKNIIASEQIQFIPK